MRNYNEKKGPLAKPKASKKALILARLLSQGLSTRSQVSFFFFSECAVHSLKSRTSFAPQNNNSGGYSSRALSNAVIFANIACNSISDGQFTIITDTDSTRGLKWLAILRPRDAGRGYTNSWTAQLNCFANQQRYLFSVNCHPRRSCEKKVSNWFMVSARPSVELWMHLRSC